MSDSTEPDYYSRVNHDLMKLIPPDARRVLEIGCGAGMLAEAYRRVNPGVVWDGIDNSEEAGKEAFEKKRITRFLEGMGGMPSAAEDYVRWLDEDDEDVYDVLIFGDVLEHMEDPWHVLKELVRTVKPGGMVIASIPNVQHWSIIRDLLRGEWEYADEGLMDRTHLRWFTLKGANQLFVDAGLHVFGRQARVFKEDGHEAFMDSFCGEDGYVDAIDNLKVFRQQTKAYQYLIRALKPIEQAREVTTPVTDSGGGWLVGGRTDIERYTVDPDPPAMLVRYLIGCAACGHVRCTEPGRFLATIPGVRVETHPAQFAEEVSGLGGLDWSPDGFDHKIVILERVPLPEKLMSMLASEGWTVILELDDVPGGNFDNLPMFTLGDCHVMRHAHAIQTTTDVMKATIERMVPGQVVRVIPNQIAELPPFPDAKFGPSDRRVRVFFGAINRPDWKPLIPELNRLIAGRDDVEFVVVNDPEFHAALETAHKELHPYLAYPEYRGLLGTCDIALLPLEDTEFNRHKSDLKALECAAEGVIPICSKIVYDRALFFAYYNPADFGLITGKLISGEWDREPNAREAYDYVRDDRLLSQHYRAIYDFYLDVSTRRANGDVTIKAKEVESE